MKIHKGDNVKIMSGKDKGLVGKVILVMTKNNKVVVEGVNLFKKHQKGETKGKGEILVINKPIDISNVKKVEVAAVEDKAEKPAKSENSRKSTKENKDEKTKTADKKSNTSKASKE